METRPTGSTAEKPESVKKNIGEELERNVSVANDGKVRSKFRMIAIITALFVRSTWLPDAIPHD